MMTAPEGLSLDALKQMGRENPVLKRTQEHELARRAKAGDREARAQIMAAHVRMAVAEARRLRTPGADQEDLAQQGVLGLIEAVDRFRLEEGVRFATFARYWVRARVMEYAMHNDGAVKCGSTKPEKALYFGLDRMRREMGVRALELLSVDEGEAIGAALGIDGDRVRRMDARRMKGDMSMDTVMPESGETFGSMYPDRSATDPETSAVERDELSRRLAMLRQALAGLPERERAIFTDRRLRDEPLTLQDLSEIHGVSRERIRQLENRALGKVQAHVSGQAVDAERRVEARWA